MQKTIDNQINNKDITFLAKNEASPQVKQKKEGNQEHVWALGDQKYTKEDIKACFADKQIFNQANIFTKKSLDDLFDDSDEEVQEQGLVAQIHKRNMQEVYDMTPNDKKFTFLWNDFFIELEKQKIKSKDPVRRSEIYKYIQSFIEQNVDILLELYNQFVIHLFTLQDNGILNTDQVSRSLRYLKEIPSVKN